MGRCWKEHFLYSLVDAHGQQLRRYFAARLPEPSEAQDLVQEVYLRILRMDRPDVIRSPRAYLFTVAASVAFEYRQKRCTRPLHVALDDVVVDSMPADSEVFGATAPETAAATAELVGQLAGLLGELPPKVRAALIWAHRDGHTYEEISVRLSVPLNRVKKYLAKALAHCRSSRRLEAPMG